MRRRRSIHSQRARGITAVVLSILILSTGCQTPEQRDAQNAVASYAVGDFSKARTLLRPISQKTNEDFVLNNVRLGSAALAQYDLDEAEGAFLRAYEVMNSLGVNSGGRSLGAVLVDEKVKVWKGEPFERAMANFYLGLIYYIRHDYANARGAFENALFKLREYANEDDKNPDKYKEVESNFVLGQLMLAKSWQRLGRDDLAQANFDAIKAKRPGLAPLADYDLNNRSNLLLLVEYGHGPLKVTDDDGAIVGFQPTPQQARGIPLPVVTLDGGYVNLADLARPPVDLLALAQDRHWQSIDTIRTIKSVLGTGLLVGGAYTLGTARRNTDAYVGLGLLAAGLLMKATSQGDVRTWEMLPRTVFVIPLNAPPGAHDVTVMFPGTSSRQTWRSLVVPATGEATYFLRSQSGSFLWPPATVKGVPEELIRMTVPTNQTQ